MVITGHRGETVRSNLRVAVHSSTRQKGEIAFFPVLPELAPALCAMNRQRIK